MNDLTDIELEQRAADGESEAFGVLYERYSPRVYDFLLRMAREPADAADLTQETFVRAMRAMSAERAGTAEFATWLFTIARNLALTRLDRAKRTQPLAEEGEDEGAYYRFDPDLLENPEAIAQAKGEIAELVWEASEALEPKQRTLLDLHVRQGLDSAEIATVLGVSKGNAYTMVSRLKDTFESAVAGLVMFRAGRRNCPELNQLLEDKGATQISPDVRKLIEQHTKSCDACQGKRRELVSATALLRALVPLPLMPNLASRIHDGAWTQIQQAAAASAAAGAGGAGASAVTSGASSGGGHAGGILSMPARALHALPGPAWLPAVAAVVVTVVAVPAAVFSINSGGSSASSNAAVVVAQPTPSSPGLATAVAAVAVVATPATSGAVSNAASVLDGTYTIALPTGNERCGPVSVSKMQLTVQGDAATVTAPSGPSLQGSVVRTGEHVIIRLNTNDGSKWLVELDGDIDAAGNIAGQSKNDGVFPSGQQGWTCHFPFTARLATTAVASASGTDALRLRAAIAAHAPGIAFSPDCPADPTASCATGSWPADVLASGIAGVGVGTPIDGGVATFYGRAADGTWVFWFGTQNSGGPQTSLPGDMIVCADGDGLNLRAEPSTSAAVVTLIPDGTTVRGDRFVMTVPPSPGVANSRGAHPDGWYHITSPQEGWAYDRFLLGRTNGVTTCIKTWWP